MEKVITKEKLLKAPALKLGDRVGLVCPSGRPFCPSVVEQCVRVVETMGFKPIIGKHVLSIHGYLAGTLEQRLKDFDQFCKDDSIAGIFCVTGGFGSMHLLPHLDYSYIAAHPKVIVGCDDNTALLSAIQTLSGLITFHGPNLDLISSKYTFERFKQAVTRTAILEPILVSDLATDPIVPLLPYTPVVGSVEGRLLGGNLTALVSLMGTPYQPNFKDAILFLEDKNERNDILDRWFTTLYVAGELSQVSAVAFGQFKDCHPRGSYNMLSLEDLFGDRLKAMAKPSCFGIPLGQEISAATVPLGCKVLLDTKQGRLDFLEPALERD